MPFAVCESKALKDHSSVASIVRIRRMFTLRLKGSVRKESAASIITLTSRPGKPQRRHPP